MLMNFKMSCSLDAESGGVVVSETTILRTLRRIHFTRKSVSIRALERNDLARSAYMNTIAELVTDPAQLVFIDE